MRIVFVLEVQEVEEDQLREVMDRVGDALKEFRVMFRNELTVCLDPVAGDVVRALNPMQSSEAADTFSGGHRPRKPAVDPSGRSETDGGTEDR